MSETVDIGDEKEINGILRGEPFVLPFTPEQFAAYRQAAEANKRLVFGADRMAEVDGKLPSQEAVDNLSWKIEELCTGADGSRGRWVHQRTIAEPGTPDSKGLDLMWNPAGVAGGFGVNVDWDAAIAHVGGIVNEKTWFRQPGQVPRLYQIREGLFIDADSGRANILRTMWPARSSHGERLYAVKPATADEVRAVTERLTPQLEADSQSDEPLPVYLEIGYGLDPSGLLTKRSYRNKAYVGVDSAVGEYENRIGRYPEAVLSQTKHFSEEANSNRPGEHIHFMVADGRRLPFGDKSVREVFLSNILNADVDDDVRQQLLGESHRVVEENGYLVVRVNWNRDDWHVEDMDAALAEHNFGTVRTVRAVDPEYARLEAQYGTPGEVIAPEGYYLIAKRESRRRPHIGGFEQLLGKAGAEQAMAENERMAREMKDRIRQVYANLGAKAVDEAAFRKEYLRLVREDIEQPRTKPEPEQ